MLEKTLGLAAVLMTCHWIGDYTVLSRPEMLAAKKFGKPLGPIADHALMHFTLMLMGIIGYLSLTGDSFQGNTKAALALILQFITHFLIDVAKGRVNAAYPSVQNPAAVRHWVVFGFDQLLHHLVILIMVWLIYVN